MELTEVERKWLNAMPSWEGASGRVLEMKFDALVELLEARRDANPNDVEFYGR